MTGDERVEAQRGNHDLDALRKKKQSPVDDSLTKNGPWNSGYYAPKLQRFYHNNLSQVDVRN